MDSRSPATYLLDAAYACEHAGDMYGTLRCLIAIVGSDVWRPSARLEFRIRLKIADLLSRHFNDAGAITHLQAAQLVIAPFDDGGTMRDDASRMLAAVYFRAGDMKAALRMSPDAKQRAGFLLANGDVHGALCELPSNAQLLLANHKYEDALEAVDSNDVSARTISIRAWALLIMGRLREAEPVIAKLSEYGNWLLPLCVFTARYSLATGQHSRAKRYAEKAIALEQSNSAVISTSATPSLISDARDILELVNLSDPILKLICQGGAANISKAYEVICQSPMVTCDAYFSALKVLLAMGSSVPTGKVVELLAETRSMKVNSLVTATFIRLVGAIVEGDKASLADVVSIANEQALSHITASAILAATKYLSESEAHAALNSAKSIATNVCDNYLLQNIESAIQTLQHDA